MGHKISFRKIRWPPKSQYHSIYALDGISYASVIETSWGYW